MHRCTAGVFEEEFAAFVAEYRKLCAVTPFVYVSLFADAMGKGVLLSFAFGALLGRPLAGAAVALAGVPFLTYFVLTFCRLPPPIHPDTFARLLIFAVTWLALGTVAVCVFVAVASKGAGQSLVPTYIAVALSVFGSVCGVSLLLKHHRRLRALCATSAS